MNKPILVITEDKNWAQSLENSMAQLGYNLCTLTDGKEGLYWARENKPEAVFSDVMIPTYNAYQVCYALKELEETKKIPFVLMTARENNNEEFWGEHLGVNGYIHKPFKAEDLVQKIKSLEENG